MKKYCANCISFGVCKYADKRDPDMCRFYLFRSNPVREIMRERERQDEKWGEQNHPMLNIPFTRDGMLQGQQAYKQLNDKRENWSWFQILMEEVYEAFSETEQERQREEMIQVAAVAVQIIEFLDRRMEAKREKNTH